eukprot:6864595-Prymnesium_polylepis.1
MAATARSAKAELEACRAGADTPRTGGRQGSSAGMDVSDDDGDVLFDDAHRCKPAETTAAAANKKEAEAAEAAAAAEALKRQREMPTWRATRGKGAGKGASKIEWGT